MGGFTPSVVTSVYFSESNRGDIMAEKKSSTTGRRSNVGPPQPVAKRMHATRAVHHSVKAAEHAAKAADHAAQGEVR